VYGKYVAMNFHDRAYSCIVVAIIIIIIIINNFMVQHD